MIRNKRTCPICGRQISISNYTKHEKSHKTNPEYQNKLAKQHHTTNDRLNCQYCNKLCKNKNSLIQHELRCSLNPNRLDMSYMRKITINHQSWNKGLTKESDARVAKYAKSFREKLNRGEIKHGPEHHSEKTKEKIRDVQLKRCAEQGTNLCGKGLRGHYKGYYCQSSWELAYVIYCLDNNISISRNTDGFKYTLDGVQRTYFPDFKLSDGTYIEIKGYYDRKTKTKESQFPSNKKLRILKKSEMTTILNYVISKYGKDYVKLYDENSN